MSKKFSPGLGLTMAALVALLVLLGLGTWQAKKIGPKTELIDHIHSGLEAAPIDLPVHVDDVYALEYHKVRFTGKIAAEPIPVYGLNLKGQPGYYLYVPVERPVGMAVIVNLGWVPQEHEGAVELPDGEIQITGVVRESAVRASMTPDNNVRKGEWYTADVFQLATVFGYHTKEFYHFRIMADQLTEPGALPLGGQVRVDIPNNHFKYMLTWYGIALALVGVYIALGLARARKDD